MRESDGRSVRGQRGWGDKCGIEGREGGWLARCVTSMVDKSDKGQQTVLEGTRKINQAGRKVGGVIKKENG